MLKIISKNVSESPTYYCNWALLFGKIEKESAPTKGKSSTTTTIYVCKDKVCNQPTSDVREAFTTVIQ